MADRLGPAVSPRVSRLEELKALLADRDLTTVADLADDLAVSNRTVHRDLAALRELGVPVAGLAGRGGGVHLERGWYLGRVHLNEREAIQLLLSLAVASRVNSPLLVNDVSSIERKLATAFAPSQTGLIRSLRRRVLIGDPASQQVKETYGSPAHGVESQLTDAFARRQVSDITYVDKTGARSERRIEIHYLMLTIPAWYALSWDQDHDGIRAFRLDRIHRLTLSDERFRVLPAEEFKLPPYADVRSL